MVLLRHTLAQVSFVLMSSAGCMLSVGCGKSHGSEDAGTEDGGRDAATDVPGLDASLDGGSDAGFDAAVATCDALDARPISCPDFICDEPDRWYWNGDECRPIACGACEGEDCERGMFSREACEIAHAECDATLCRETDGEWMWWVQECGHRICGLPTLADCVIGTPVCNCGPTATFVPGMGCMPDECPEIDPLPPEDLCASTGGEWGGFCCHSVCGERCADACVNPACHCPALQVFDAALGCIDSARCYDRSAGETCEPEARCEAGTICCQNCGGAGCFGSECRAPLCDDDPDIDMCGNNLLAP